MERAAAPEVGAERGQLRLLEHGRSGQDLVVEALNDLFGKNGKPSSHPAYGRAISARRHGAPLAMSPRGHRGWNDRARAKAEAVKRQRQLAVERPVLDTIRALRAEGRSWRAVAACLEGRFDPPGHRGKWAAGSWTHKSVQRIARRHGIADAPSAETPRSPPPPPAPTRQPTLADLDLEETLTARCPRCHHARTLEGSSEGLFVRLR